MISLMQIQLFYKNNQNKGHSSLKHGVGLSRLQLH